MEEVASTLVQGTPQLTWPHLILGNDWNNPQNFNVSGFRIHWVGGIYRELFGGWRCRGFCLNNRFVYRPPYNYTGRTPVGQGGARRLIASLRGPKLSTPPVLSSKGKA